MWRLILDKLEEEEIAARDRVTKGKSKGKHQEGTGKPQPTKAPNKLSATTPANLQHWRKSTSSTSRLKQAVPEA